MTLTASTTTTTTTPRKRVHFACSRTNEVHNVERIEAGHAIELFYQADDYAQFRLDYSAWKKVQKSNRRRIQQMEQRLTSFGKVNGMSTPAPALLAKSLQPSQSQRGCARMA